MSTPTSTRANPSKRLNWLFFDPKWNADCGTHGILVSGYSLERDILEELDWVGELKESFR